MARDPFACHSATLGDIALYFYQLQVLTALNIDEAFACLVGEGVGCDFVRRFFAVPVGDGLLNLTDKAEQNPMVDSLLCYCLPRVALEHRNELRLKHAE